MDLGFGEILFILVVILLMFGPDKLPEVAKKLGRYYRQLNEYKRYLDEEIKKGFLEDVDEVFKSSEVKREESKSNAKPEIDDEIRSIASSLDIDTEGKNREELLKEIRSRVKREEEANEQ